MDTERFPAWVRLVAAMPSRRDLGRAAAGIAAGSLLAPLVAAPVGEAKHKRKSKKKKHPPPPPPSAPPPPPNPCAGRPGQVPCWAGCCAERWSATLELRSAWALSETAGCYDIAESRDETATVTVQGRLTPDVPHPTLGQAFRLDFSFEAGHYSAAVEEHARHTCSNPGDTCTWEHASAGSGQGPVQAQYGSWIRVYPEAGVYEHYPFLHTGFAMPLVGPWSHSDTCADPPESEDGVDDEVLEFFPAPEDWPADDLFPMTGSVIAGSVSSSLAEFMGEGDGTTTYSWTLQPNA